MESEGVEANVCEKSGKSCPLKDQEESKHDQHNDSEEDYFVRMIIGPFIWLKESPSR